MGSVFKYRLSSKFIIQELYAVIDYFYGLYLSCDKKKLKRGIHK